VRRRRLAAVALVALARIASADDGGGIIPGYRLDTTVSSGYRFVDVDGSLDKYREDYNLRAGPRLFLLDVDGAAKAPDQTRLDRFHIQVDTPGNEPVSHFRLTADDRELYDLRVNFTRSNYFYAVPQLFEEPVAGDVRLDDLHDWRFVRTDGAVDLTVHAPHLPTILLGYRLYERQGDAISTVNVPGGDTFLVGAPVDSTTHVGRLGTTFRALDTDVFLQQEYRRIDRTHDLGPVQNPQGVDPTDTSTLSFFRSDQDERIDIPATTVRLRRAFGDRVDVTSAYYYSHADLAFNLNRKQVATAAPPFGGTTTEGGGGGATLDTHVVDSGVTVRASERVLFHFTYRFNERTESGNLDDTSSFGALATTTGDRVRVHGATADVEWDPRDDLELRAGARYARRDARFSVANQDISTDTVGAVGSARYRPWSFLDLFARYENVQIDDPFVVPGDPLATPALPERQIALTFTNRATAGLRLTPREWMSLSYQLTSDSRENDTFGARSRAFGNTVALTLDPIPDLSLYAAYTRRDRDARAEILTAPLYTQTASVQNGLEDVLVVQLRYDFARFGQKWSAGSDFAYVNTEDHLRPNLEPGLAGTKLFALDRTDFGVFLAWHHPWLEPSIDFRHIGYREQDLPANNYRATIVALKLTKRFNW
jgi:hypothetical protein